MKKSKIPFRDYWDILSKYLKKRKPAFILLIFLMMSGISLQLFNPQIVRYVLDNALKGTPPKDLILPAVLYIVFAIVYQGFGVSAAYLGENLAWKATNELREDLATHCINLDMSYHNDTTPGELIQRLDSDVAEFSNFFSMIVIRIFTNIFLMIGIIIALFSENIALGIVFTLFATFTLVTLSFIKNIAVEPEKLLREANTELSGFLEERLAATEDIRSCGAVDYVLNGMYRIHRNILLRWKRAGIMRFWVRMITGLILVSGFAASFIFGYFLYQQGIMTVGTVFLIVYYINLLSQPVRELSQQVDNLQNVGASVERIRELKAITPTIHDGDGKPLPASKALALDFRSVSFSYLPEEPVLQNVSFSLPPGEILGLLGRTGSGKTTLARLVFRLHEPDQGDILLNGQNLCNTKLKDLRHRVALVTQDVQLFQASIRENITFFDNDISDDRILEAIDALGLTQWLKGLPEGLDTRLETSGKSLSAGEAQLLAFTRVFLRNPGLVILDEASSRLDPATERLIERTIDRLLTERSAIIIAHRLSSVQRADDILILDKGCVSEYGKRNELMGDKDSRFSSLLHSGMEEFLI